MCFSRNVLLVGFGCNPAKKWSNVQYRLQYNTIYNIPRKVAVLVREKHNLSTYWVFSVCTHLSSFICHYLPVRQNMCQQAAITGDPRRELSRTRGDARPVAPLGWPRSLDWHAPGTKKFGAFQVKSMRIRRKYSPHEKGKNTKKTNQTTLRILKGLDDHWSPWSQVCERTEKENVRSNRNFAHLRSAPHIPGPDRVKSTPLAVFLFESSLVFLPELLRFVKNVASKGSSFFPCSSGLPSIQQRCFGSRSLGWAWCSRFSQHHLTFSDYAALIQPKTSQNRTGLDAPQSTRCQTHQPLPEDVT